MHRRHVWLLGTAGLLLTALVAFGTSSAVLAQGTNGTAEETSFGAQVSSFMQSSAADAENSVDRGMWEASAATAANPDATVRDRADKLQQRLDTLERQSQELASLRESGEVDVAYVARASRVRVGISNLRRSIDSAAAAAQNQGVDSDQLSRLRQAAGSVDGPEIAEIARTITDADENGERPGRNGDSGPPDERPGDGTPGDGPPDDNPPDDRPPDDGTPGGGDGGPPEGGSGDGGPGDGGPGDGSPGDGDSGDGDPGDGGPGDGDSGDGDPGDGSPSDGDSGDGGPGDGDSGDGGPGDGSPGDGDSGDGGPGDGGPGDGGPGDGGPGDGGPGDGGPGGNS